MILRSSAEYIPDHISIVFPNLNGYDAYLIIREFNKDDIRVIAETKVTYIRFNVKINAC